MNQNNQLEYYQEELEDILEDKTEVPAWVVAEMATATQNISDVTHYLDGEKEILEEEQENLMEQEDEDEVIVNNIPLPSAKKTELTKKFTEDALVNLKGFLKGKEGVELEDDYTFIYNGEKYEIEPIIDSDDDGVLNALFTVYNKDDEEVGEITYMRGSGKQKFNAKSNFFKWSNTKFADGGAIKNQYESRTIENIWNNWTLSQKLHFLSDHSEEVYGSPSVKGQVNNKINEFFGKLIYQKYDDLPLNTKVALIMHTTRGQYAYGGGMEGNNIDAELEDFDIDELDDFETMQYNQFLPSSGKVGALQILINNVEGDYSQLSEELAELAEKQMSSEEYDEATRDMRFERDGYANGGMMAKGGAFKPYGKTKGRYTINYIADSKKQSEIWETKEMAVTNAKRYTKIDEYSDVMVFDDKGTKIDFLYGGSYADGGELKGKFLAEIGVPYNYEKVVEDKFGFTEFLSKTLTKKWFGNGVWRVTMVKPLFEKNYGQKIVVEIDIPLGVTQGGGLDKFDVLEFMSKTLTKKWFGNGVWSVEVVNSYADGGELNGQETINLKSYNIHGQLLDSGKIVVDYDDSTIQFPSGKTLKVVPDREFTYRFQKTQIKASQGIRGLVEFLKEINNEKSPFNPSVTSLFIDFGKDGKYANGGSLPFMTDPTFGNFQNQVYAKGGIIVTKIKDIPNLKDKVEKGQVTYRGLGLGKLADDFYKLAGQNGTRIKVDGQEYFITDDDFKELDWDFKNEKWMNKVRFSASARKYDIGGVVVEDLAGHTGGSFSTNTPTLLSGVSDTNYGGLTGETGAMSAGEMFATGGSLEEFSDNQLMIMNQNVELEHHQEELEDILEDKTEIPAWVVAKMATATQSISDVTNYLDGEKEILEEDDEIVNETTLTLAKKNELTNKFTEDALVNFKGFLKGMEDIDLRDDYSFDYRGQRFEIYPIVNADENGVFDAMFSIFNVDGEKVGDVSYSIYGGKQKFTANSEFFGWNNTKFAYGGKTKIGQSMKELYIGQIASLTGTRTVGIEKFLDDNKLTESELSNLMTGIGRGMVKRNDFVTALVGEKGNPIQKEIIAFAKSDKAYKMAYGGVVVEDLAGHTGGSFSTNTPTLLSGVSDTNYGGLTGETGAMSAGEMFEMGGGLPSGAEQRYVDYYLNPSPILAEGGKVDSFIPNVGTIDNYMLKSLLIRNPKVKLALGDKEFEFLKNKNTDCIGVSSKPYNVIVTDGKEEFELDMKKWSLTKPLTEARTKIKSHYSANYAEGGSLEAHGIEEGDTFIKTIAGSIQKVKDVDGKIVFINLSTGERDSQPPLPFKKGGNVDGKWVNHSQDYEVRYAKGKNRHGYGHIKYLGGGVVDGALNKKVYDLASKSGFLISDWSTSEYNLILAQALVESLTDANFHSEAKEVVAKLEKKPWSDEMYETVYYDPDKDVVEFSITVARICDYGGDDIVNAYYYLAKMQGSSVGNLIDDLFLSKSKTTGYKIKPSTVSFSIFEKIINESKSEEDAFNKAREVKGIPLEVSKSFMNKYDPNRELTPRQSFSKFYKEVKANASKPSTVSFKPTVEFNVGDVVWNKEDKRYGVVMDNYDNKTDGNRGEIRLDSTGNTYIFEYDKKSNRNGYNLVKFGSSEDDGDGDVQDIKDSANRLIKSQIEYKDKKKEKYYREIFKRVLGGEFDKKTKSNLNRHGFNVKIEEVSATENGKNKLLYGANIFFKDDLVRFFPAVSGDRKKIEDSIESWFKSLKSWEKNNPQSRKSGDFVVFYNQRGDEAKMTFDNKKDAYDFYDALKKVEADNIIVSEAPIAKMIPNLKKYYVSHDNIESVTLKKGGKEVTYDAKDVLNGANMLEKGGRVEKIANYISKNNVVHVELKDGTHIKPSNGYWIKKGATPINKMDEGGNLDKVKWQDAEIGDSARVKDVNRMGLIIKNYGRKFHLMFPNGTEKTFDASDLEFFKLEKDEYEMDDDYNYKKGGKVEEATINKDGIRVRSVSQPKKKLTEAEWLAKYSESKEARSYKSGGDLSKYSEFIQDEFASSKRLANKFAKKYNLPFLVLVEKDNDDEIYVKEANGFYAFPKSYIDAHDVLYVTADKMAEGGVTFDEKSSSIAKKFVGKAVEPKYQKEYGKVYSKEEANEVGDKIAGSMVAKEKMKKGGDFPDYGETVDAKDIDYDMKSYFNRTNKKLVITTKDNKKSNGSVTKFYNDLIFVTKEKHDIPLKDIRNVKILEEKMAKGGVTNRGGIMLLAKQIRKENESWKDALKRAGEQLRK
jgi:hypothetical protein